VFRCAIILSALALLAGCGPDYSPNSYSAKAVQQANKVERGVVVGVRPVQISTDGAVGALTGAAAGGAIGSQAPGGLGSTLGAIGGGLVGGLVGSGVEQATTDTSAYEYIVQKPNKELVSVTQKDEVPIGIGERVLVIAGPQARIVQDYTVRTDPTPPLPVMPRELPPPAALAAPQGTAEMMP
jgi:outer membrane lipoprotein SlyB